MPKHKRDILAVIITQVQEQLQQQQQKDKEQQEKEKKQQQQKKKEEQQKEEMLKKDKQHQHQLEKKEKQLKHMKQQQPHFDGKTDAVPLVWLVWLYQQTTFEQCLKEKVHIRVGGREFSRIRESYLGLRIRN